MFSNMLLDLKLTATRIKLIQTVVAEPVVKRIFSNLRRIEVRPIHNIRTYPSYFEDAIVLLLKFLRCVIRLENNPFITVFNKLYLIKLSVSTKFTVLNHVSCFCCFLFLIYLQSAVLFES